MITSSGNLLWLAKGQVIEFYGYAQYWNNLSKDSVLLALQQGQALTELVYSLSYARLSSQELLYDCSTWYCHPREDIRKF